MKRLLILLVLGFAGCADEDSTTGTKDIVKSTKLTDKQATNLLADEVGRWKVTGKSMPRGGKVEPFDFIIDSGWREKGKSINFTFSPLVNGTRVPVIGRREYDPLEGVFIWRSKQEGSPEMSGRDQYDPATKTYRGNYLHPDGVKETKKCVLVSKDEMLITSQFELDGEVVFSSEAIVTRLVDTEDPKTDKSGISPVGHDQNLMLTLKGHSSTVLSVTFSPDGKRIASTGYDRTVIIWDSETGEKKLTIKKAHSREITTVLFSPDGKRILTQSCYGNTRIKMWDAETGHQLLENTDYGSYGSCVALSPDGKRVAMGDTGKARVCDLQTGNEVVVFQGGWKCIGFSPDGKWIVVGYGTSGRIMVWDAETGETRKFSGGHSDEVSDVRFSPDGTQFISGGGDTVKVWDFKTGEELLTLEKANPNNVSFSSDGQRIVSSGNSKIKVWDSNTGEIILTLRPNPSFGSNDTCGAINPDGNRFVNGGFGKGDALLKVWDISGVKPGSDRKADGPSWLALDTRVEKVMRRELERAEGAITQADFEKVTELNFSLAGVQIADADFREVVKCKQLKLLNCNAGQITAQGVKEVAKLQKLEKLGLSELGVTDEALKEVAKCTQLTYLNLMRTKLTDAGLKEVAKLRKLNELNLAYNKITGVGLKELANLNQLRQLWLDGTQVTKADVAELKKALPECRISGP